MSVDIIIHPIMIMSDGIKFIPKGRDNADGNRICESQYIRTGN
jgi:hypothetical protein